MAALRAPDALPVGGGDAAPASISASLCEQCGQHPKLGSLKRCKSCIQAAADADRQHRTEAEARVKARTAKDKPSLPFPPKRICRTCHKHKPLDAFAKHNRSIDGRRKSCKGCVKAGRAITKPRTAEQLEKAKASAAKPESREKNRQAVADWSSRHPEAVRARRILRQAVKRGQIVPPPVCQIEGCENGRVLGHHPSYAKPLTVLWCCAHHHKLIHSGVLLALKNGTPKSLARIPPELRKAA